MKILYSIGNRFGADIQLIRFLEKLDKKHEVKISAYINSSISIPHIDWTLDALYYNVIGSKKQKELTKLFHNQIVPALNFQNSTIFINDVGEFNPDLIISDFEPLSAYVAKIYNKQLWYCSSLHLLDGCNWDEDIDLTYLHRITKIKASLKNLPQANKYYIYSCFGDIINSLSLNKNYEWIMPYYKNINNLFEINNIVRFNNINKIYNYLDERKTDFLITDGSTSNVSDAFYSSGKIIVCPTLNNPENIINAIMVKKYKIGCELGQVELMDKFCIEQFEKYFDKEYNENYLNIQNHLQLHEKVEEYATRSF